jgi:hypothetical protein
MVVDMRKTSQMQYRQSAITNKKTACQLPGGGFSFEAVRVTSRLQQ